MSKIIFTVPKLLYSMTSHAGVGEPGRYDLRDILFAHRYNADLDRSALVTTDGRRLALLEWPAEVDLADPFEALIPTPSIKALRAPKQRDPPYRLTIGAADGANPVALQLSRGSESVDCELRDDYRFPPFRDIIPRYADHLCKPETPCFAIDSRWVVDAARLHSDFARLCDTFSDQRGAMMFWNGGWRWPVLTESFGVDVTLRVIIAPINPWGRQVAKSMSATCEDNERRRYELERAETTAA